MSEGAPSPPSSPGPSSSQHTDQEMRGRGKDEERGRGKGSKGKDGEKEVVALQVKFLFCKKHLKQKQQKKFHSLSSTTEKKWEMGKTNKELPSFTPAVNSAQTGGFLERLN